MWCCSQGRESGRDRGRRAARSLSTTAGTATTVWDTWIRSIRADLSAVRRRRRTVCTRAGPDAERRGLSCSQARDSPAVLISDTEIMVPGQRDRRGHPAVARPHLVDRGRGAAPRRHGPDVGDQSRRPGDWPAPG